MNPPTDIAPLPATEELHFDHHVPVSGVADRVRFLEGWLFDEEGREAEETREPRSSLKLHQDWRPMQKWALAQQLLDPSDAGPAEEAELGGKLSVVLPASQHVLMPVVWHRPADETTREAFTALQRWEGVVTECLEESFVARLTDLTEEGPLEEVELALEDVAPEDRSLVGPGAVFYWSIGYRDDESGRRSRESTLRFRRLPVWSEAELEAARERAREVAKAFGGE